MTALFGVVGAQEILLLALVVVERGCEGEQGEGVVVGNCTSGRQRETLYDGEFGLLWHDFHATNDLVARTSRSK